MIPGNGQCGKFFEGYYKCNQQLIGTPFVQPFEDADQCILRAEPPGFGKHGSSVSPSSHDEAERNTFEQAVHDANARRAKLRERFASAIAADQPQNVPRSALDLFHKLAREAFDDNAAVSALCRCEKDDGIGTFGFETCDLCKRYRIQRAHLQENTGGFCGREEPWSG